MSDGVVRIPVRLFSHELLLNYFKAFALSAMITVEPYMTVARVSLLLLDSQLDRSPWLTVVLKCQAHK